MGRLYDLVREIEDFEFEIDEETGEILNANDLDNLELEKNEKIEQLCLWIKNLKSDAAAYKAEKDSFAKSRRRLKTKLNLSRITLLTYWQAKNSRPIE